MTNGDRHLGRKNEPHTSRWAVRFFLAVTASTAVPTLACSPHDNPAQPASEPASEPANKPAVPGPRTRSLPPEVDADSSDAVDSSDAADTSDAGTPPSGDPVELIGVVHEDGVHMCEAETFEERWVDKFYQVGWVAMVSPPALDQKLASLTGQVVKVVGSPTDLPPTSHGGDEAPKAIGMCPQYQMRSDWRITAEGIRRKRSPSLAFGKLQIRHVEVVEPLEARRVADEVEVTMQNPFDRALDNVRVVAHYEGCFGKPGATTRTWELGDVGASADASAPHRFPAVVEESHNPRGKFYALRSLELIATDAETPARAFVDLDLEDRDDSFHGRCP